MGAIAEYPGWEWGSVPRMRIKKIRAVDGLLPQELARFWASLEACCVAGCCGVDAFDLRADYVRWVMRLSDRTPAEIPGNSGYRPPDALDVDEIVEMLTQGALRLSEMTDKVVGYGTLNTYITPGELASLFRYMADVLTWSGTGNYADTLVGG